MGMTLVLASALAMQSAGQPAVDASAVDQVDVAYQELNDGRNVDAVDKLEASALVREGDPAALINLGTAYARKGNLDKARDCYKAALASDDRYVLELQDGSWIDSRRAARKALNVLADGQSLALR